MNVMRWLLDSDPAIKWQVMRDLTEEDEPLVAAERSRVATEGWGARVASPPRILIPPNDRGRRPLKRPGRALLFVLGVPSALLLSRG
jgi:hypothetical protein